MYVENDALFTFTKLARVPLMYKTMRVMLINYSIEVVYIWTIAGFLSV